MCDGWRRCSNIELRYLSIFYSVDNISRGVSYVAAGVPFSVATACSTPGPLLLPPRASTLLCICDSMRGVNVPRQDKLFCGSMKGMRGVLQDKKERDATRVKAVEIYTT